MQQPGLQQPRETPHPLCRPADGALLAGRLQPLCGPAAAVSTTTELKEHKTGSKQNISRIIAAEGDKILQKIGQQSFVVALDEQGQSLTSEGVADFLHQHMLNGTPEITLVIGGPYGLSPEVRNRADRLLSLSAMTLTHQMARLLLLEQLYRGCTILRNEPYHHA